MEDWFKKVSEYQIFNFMLSGAIFVVLLSKTTDIDLLSESLIASFFIFYFVGLVLSRIGSLIIEPVSKKLKLVSYVPYNEYLVALKKDPKLDTLSQENNTYRTLVATFIVYLIVFAANENLADTFAGKSSLLTYAIIILIILIFALAYRKQTSYIVKRVKKAGSKR